MLAAGFAAAAAAATLAVRARASARRRPLSAAEVRQFEQTGVVLLRGAFSRETARRCREFLWARMEASPDAPAQWPERERVSAAFTAADAPCWGHVMTPRLSAALSQLLGTDKWTIPGYGFWPVTFPGVARPPWRVAGSWHVDGWFPHTADSGRQALLPLFLFSDIDPQGGGTVVAEGSHLLVARLLPRSGAGLEPAELAERIKEIDLGALTQTETVGSAGDVLLVHPFAVHARSTNLGSRVRFICNPTVALEPGERLQLEAPRGAVERSIARAVQ